MSIDLTQRDDLRLVHRAVVNDWPVPEHVRDAICAQLGAAIEAAHGDVRRTLLLGKLMVRMEAWNMVDEGHAKSKFPYLRRRAPEKRRPRPGRGRGNR